MDIHNEVHPWIPGYGLSDEERARFVADGADFSSLEDYCKWLKYVAFDDVELQRVRDYMEGWHEHRWQMWSSWYLFRAFATIDSLQDTLDAMRAEVARLEGERGR